MQSETQIALGNGEAITMTSGTGICLFHATSEQSLRFVNEIHGNEDLRKCSLQLRKEERN